MNSQSTYGSGTKEQGNHIVLTSNRWSLVLAKHQKSNHYAASTTAAKLNSTASTAEVSCAAACYSTAGHENIAAAAVTGATALANETNK